MEDNPDAMLERVASSNVADPFTKFIVSLEQARCGPAHPSQVMESTSLASISLPNVKYKLKRQLLSGKLSDVQLEGILLACHTHNKFHEGRRCGMLIGDGAGVGKGRTIAGIILENLLEGRGKSIWISTNADLFIDARRDMRAVGITNEGALRNFKKLYNEKVSLPGAPYCLFMTYTSLTRGNRTDKLASIKKWLGHNFEGIIALDECHAIKSQDSKAAAALQALDKAFPKARFVYCSATVAEKPSDIRYMNRLFLWGPGTSYPRGFKEVEKVLNSVGFLGMESIAMELKNKGCLVARRLDQGDADFNIEEVKLDENDKATYNKCTELWNKILCGIDIFCGGNQLRRQMRYYWAQHQRFFKLLNVSFKINWIVKFTKRRVREGNAVVIGIQSTGVSTLTAVCLMNR